VPLPGAYIAALIVKAINATESGQDRIFKAARVQGLANGFLLAALVK
jgi:hypothetical protein